MSGSGMRLFRGRNPTESEISSRPLSKDVADLILVDDLIRSQAEMMTAARISPSYAQE